ncbi:hypothetical protein D3C80_1743160 [compost metagenome]
MAATTGTRYHLVDRPCRMPNTTKSITLPSVLPMVTPRTAITVKPRPVNTAWMRYRTGATNRNRNSIGSVVPPTTHAITPEISRPLIL